MKKNLSKYSALLILILNTGILSQGLKVPVEIQFELIPKIIAFDNNFEERTEGSEVVKIGVIYSNNIKNSLRITENIRELVNKKDITIRNKTAQIIFIDHTNINELANKHQLYALFITPIRGIDISALSDLCKKNKIMSFSSRERFFESGLSVFIDLVNNKPKITLNLESLKNEGIELSSYLLKLAAVRQ